MLTIPVDVVSPMPMLLILELITALIIFTAGILFISKHSMFQNNKKKSMIAGVMLGVVAAAAMFGVYKGVETNVANTNETNLRTAVSSTSETFNENQINELITNGVTTLENSKIVIFTEDGAYGDLTIFDDEENAAAQAEAEKLNEQKMKENDY